MDGLFIYIEHFRRGLIRKLPPTSNAIPLKYHIPEAQGSPFAMGLSIFGVSNYTNSHWVSEPNQRGTYSLISTCILTLGLCVYSAIHLNIPEHRATKTTVYLRKLKWLLIALLAPEFVVYVAWRQRDQAKKALKILRRHYEQDEPRAWWTKLANFLSCCHSSAGVADEEKVCLDCCLFHA